MTLTDLSIATLFLALYNLMVFRTFWRDKNAARNGERRVSERTLLWLALFAGSPGAVAAQRLLRHKTRKEPFRSRLLGILIFHLLAVGGLVILTTSSGLRATLTAVFR